MITIEKWVDRIRIARAVSIVVLEAEKCTVASAYVPIQTTGCEHILAWAATAREEMHCTEDSRS